MATSQAVSFILPSLFSSLFPRLCSFGEKEAAVIKIGVAVGDYLGWQARLYS